MIIEKAIEECQRLWQEIESSGLSKGDFLLGTEEGGKWLAKDYYVNCPLCQYAWDMRRTVGKIVEISCIYCPLPMSLNEEELDSFTRCFKLGFEEEKRSKPEWFAVIRELK